MSLTDTPEGKPVHFPSNPNKFAFDREVSAIFNDMAKRAIPNFYEAHDAHARMLDSWVKRGASILDIGASRGAFFHALKRAYPFQWERGLIALSGIDNSPDMCNYLRNDFPEAEIECMDIASPTFLNSTTTYDVVCAHYVLQFVEPRFQEAVLQRMIDAVAPGGVFVYGHKAKHYGALGDLMHEEYIRFRVGNGYTREEIQAKTAALKGSMFPVDHNHMMNIVNINFSEAVETYRFMMFSTIFAVK